MAAEPSRVTSTRQTQLPTTPETRTLKPHEVVMSPSVQAAVAIEAWSKFAGEVDLTELVETLGTRIKRVQSGDVQPIEAMLFGQAMTLETIFTSLARRAVRQGSASQFQTFLALALKAQAQCRATLEALAEVKHPRPVAFVKQANISGCHQQVNNGMQPAQQYGSAQLGGGIGGRFPSDPSVLETSPVATQGEHPPFDSANQTPLSCAAQAV